MVLRVADIRQKLRGFIIELLVTQVFIVILVASSHVEVYIDAFGLIIVFGDDSALTCRSIILWQSLG